MAARRAPRTLMPWRTPSPRVLAPGRRPASTSTEVVRTVQRNRTGIIYSIGGLAALFAGVAYFSGDTSSSRRRAIAKIDRARSASGTPSVVSQKATEAKQSSPPTSDDQSSQGEAEDVSQEAAFNPETGEINWECPCLGGMAHGTCGEPFKAAFSCFVFSEAEPKGMDCLDKFQAMQECFREHPGEYAEVIKDDESLDSLEAEVAAAPGSDATHEFHNAQAANRMSGGAGPIDRVRADAKKLKEKAETVVANTKAAIDGTQVSKPPKSEREHNDGKPIKQPQSGDGEHKSAAASGKSGSLGSGYDENADHHVAGGAGSSSTFSGASGKGGDSLHPEKTPNTTRGEKDPHGRNAASGDKPSGSAKAHDAHKEGVEKTRTGSDRESSKERVMSRG